MLRVPNKQSLLAGTKEKVTGVYKEAHMTSARQKRAQHGRIGVSLIEGEIKHKLPHFFNRTICVQLLEDNIDDDRMARILQILDESVIVLHSGVEKVSSTSNAPETQPSMCGRRTLLRPISTAEPKSMVTIRFIDLATIMLPGLMSP
jgi:hypothetical protein